MASIQQELVDLFGYTTGLNYRLTESISGSNRVYAGDSRFMGVQAVEDLRARVRV